MGTTAAERKRLQRERLKEKGLYQEYVKKETEKKRHLRKLFKERASKEARETLKKKRKEEQRKYCFKKQQAKRNAGNANSVNELDSPAYKTRASFGKAVAKAKRALPASPRKRSTVVRALFKNVNPAEIKAKKRGRAAISSETTDLVSLFYVKDTISYQAPGMKDYIITKTPDGKKHKMQKRYLYFTIGEIFEEFKREYPDVDIGLSKFSYLRPKHVMLQSQTPENLCLCLYHENIRLLLEAVPNFPKRTGDFVSAIVCDPDNKDCMLQTCNECGELKKYRILMENATENKDSDEIYMFRQWLKDEDKLIRAKQSATIGDVLNKIEEKCTYFLWHKYIQVKQASNFD